VERVEAEAIVDGDRETAIGLLFRLGELVEANELLRLGWPTSGVG
jgi:hypothetical protein